MEGDFPNNTARKPLMDFLTDFREERDQVDVDKERSGGDDSSEIKVNPPEEEKFYLSQVEIDQIRKDAHEAGRTEGFQAAARESNEALGNVIRHVIAFLGEEASRSKKIMEEASKAFVEGLSGSVTSLVSHPEICSSLERSLATDITDLIAGCGGKISIAVSPEDEGAIREELKCEGDISILPDQGVRRGEARLMSGTNEITIDHKMWAKQVQEKVLSAVKTAGSFSPN